MFVYKIKHWHVWACPFATQSVTSWGTSGVFALNVTLRFATVGVVWWPKKRCKLSLKYEIKNENNFAVFATFVKRSRNEMLTMVARFQHVLSCAFKWSFLENARPHFGHCIFCDTWPCTKFSCCWRSLSLLKISAQRWQENFPLIVETKVDVTDN